MHSLVLFINRGRELPSWPHYNCHTDESYTELKRDKLQDEEGVKSEANGGQLREYQGELFSNGRMWKKKSSGSLKLNMSQFKFQTTID